MTDSRIRIDADLLIPGRSEPMPAASVILEDGRISYVGRTADAPTAPTIVRVPAVMPGIWDCHNHYFGMPVPNIEKLMSSRPAVLVARSVRDLAAELNAGITSVREVGGYGVDLRIAIDEGAIVGPTIYGASRPLSMTGGHGDIHPFPLETVDEVAASIPFVTFCDGVDACLRGVRLQLRAGARIIKVHASGGVLSEIDDPLHQQLSELELRTIVEEAARSEVSVAAHCHGKAGMLAALRAGVRTIEHGTYLDDEIAELMLEKDAVLVPTRFVVERLLGMKATLAPYSYEKAIVVAGKHEAAIQTAIKAGVKIATGTDLFVSGSMHGQNSLEIHHLIDLGMSPLGAIEAGTANAPLTLGKQAPKSGRLEVGFDADVIALNANPLEDLSIWGAAARVTHVWKGGRPFKQPVAAAAASVAAAS